MISWMFRKWDHVTLKGWAVIISILLPQCPILSTRIIKEIFTPQQASACLYLSFPRIMSILNWKQKRHPQPHTHGLPFYLYLLPTVPVFMFKPLQTYFFYIFMGKQYKIRLKSCSEWKVWGTVFSHILLWGQDLIKNTIREYNTFYLDESSGRPCGD